MAVAPQVSYPGVYVQEVPSDVRTITPVETATTAFIGRAMRGPVNKPVICNSYADFQRIFGGLWLESRLGYAVNQFFLNGGSKAIIVRLFKSDSDRAKASLSVPSPHPAAQEVFNAVAKAAAVSGVTVEELKTSSRSVSGRIEAAAKDANEAAKAVFPGNPKTAESVLQAAEKALISKQFHPAAQRVLNAVKEKYDTVKALTDENAKINTLKQAADVTVDKIAEEGKAATDAAKGVNDAVQKAKDAQKALQTARTALVPDGKQLGFEARYPGAWGNDLCVRVTDVDPKVSDQLATQYGVEQQDLFNLTVHDRKTGASESFPNVTVVPGPRQLDKVLEKDSELVRVAGDLPSDAARPNSHPGPESGKNWWDDLGAFSAPTGEATDGEALTSTEYLGSEAEKTGIYALEHTDIFNLLCIPPYKVGDVDVDTDVLVKAAAYCEKRRAMLLLDPPNDWSSKENAKKGFPISELSSDNAAIFFPRIQAPNPLRDNQIEEFAPSGAIAGIFARTDATRGVWKAPAGQEATLRGVVGLTVPLTDAENGELNPLGINCLRQMPAAGYVVWGARTIVGDDRLASQWKYIPVRRTALYIEESLYRGTQWAVFEPNDEPLWSQLRLNITVFMHGLFRQGAFQGQSPKDAYFVKCDSTTTTQADIDRGIVNIIVGFAPLKPAEFVVLYIQQIAGQLNV